MTTYSDSWKIARPFARPIIAAVRTVTLRVAQAFLAFRHRRDTVLLASFDDRMLADIGLTRTELRQALREPLWRDPTALLASRVEARRATRRGIVPPPSNSFTAPPIVPEADGEGDPATCRRAGAG